ncbi:hypothetical protein BD408DRAFT_427307, partial [Parasitella parasitica]
MAIVRDDTLYESLFCITSFGCKCQNLFYYLGMVQVYFCVQYLNIYNNMRDAASLLLFRVFYM